MTSSYRKKLIEVALPLEAISKASARAKSILMQEVERERSRLIAMWRRIHER